VCVCVCARARARADYNDVLHSLPWGNLPVMVRTEYN